MLAISLPQAQVQRYGGRPPRTYDALNKGLRSLLLTCITGIVLKFLFVTFTTPALHAEAQMPLVLQSYHWYVHHVPVHF
jgi:hypothetical protein